MFRPRMFEIEVFKVFLLVLVRFTGLIVAAPVLGSNNIPVIAKIGLSGLTALLITPTVPALDQPLPDDAFALASMAAGELMIGLMIGFVMTIAFAAIQVGGQVLDMQTGFGLMNIFNPAMETQVPIFGFFLFLIAALYLLVTDGHAMMIRALASTYSGIPLGGFVAKPELLFEVSTWGRVMFIDGFLIAAPVAGALMLAYMTMGLLGRLIPQIHLFVIGFPITIAMGLLIVALSLSVYLQLLDGMFYRMFRDVGSLIRGLA
ncbi:MAG: flagellar biosynthetic protein FliR [Candidatus Hydrogenedentes bacterium]|nr:flagellar biosynthetic protein FliR [Candidatus Hydrogenedentota bacterium]